MEKFLKFVASSGKFIALGMFAFAMYAVRKGITTEQIKVLGLGSIVIAIILLLLEAYIDHIEEVRWANLQMQKRIRRSICKDLQ